jgi:MFS family permease
MGVLGAAFGIGFALGPAMGGVMSHRFGPAAPAWAAAMLAALAALLSHVRLREARPAAPVESETWLHPRQFLPVLRNPLLLRINLLWFMAMGAFVMMDVAIAMLLNRLFGWNDLGIGVYFFFVGTIILAVQGGLVHRLNQRLGEWRLCWIGLIAVTLGALATAAASWAPGIVLVFTGALVHSCGRSLFQPAISALASREADENIQGTSLGLFQGVGTLARALWPLIAGVLYKAGSSLPWTVGAGLTFLCAGAVLKWSGRTTRT